MFKNRGGPRRVSRGEYLLQRSLWAFPFLQRHYLTSVCQTPGATWGGPVGDAMGEGTSVFGSKQGQWSVLIRRFSGLGSLITDNSTTVRPYSGTLLLSVPSTLQRWFFLQSLNPFSREGPLTFFNWRPERVGPLSVEYVEVVREVRCRDQYRTKVNT